MCHSAQSKPQASQAPAQAQQGKGVINFLTGSQSLAPQASSESKANQVFRKKLRANSCYRGSRQVVTLFAFGVCALGFLMGVSWLFMPDLPGAGPFSLLMLAMAISTIGLGVVIEVMGQLIFDIADAGIVSARAAIS
jgi:hypothetical protein